MIIPVAGSLPMVRLSELQTYGRTDAVNRGNSSLCQQRFFLNYLLFLSKKLFEVENLGHGSISLKHNF